MERKSRSDKTKARGSVPKSFGYVKRSTSSSNGKGDPRTAQVSAVPRTKVNKNNIYIFIFYTNWIIMSREKSKKVIII